MLLKLLPNYNFSAFNIGTGFVKLAEIQQFKAETLKFVGGVRL